MQTLANDYKKEKYDPRFSKIEAVIVKVTHKCNLDCTYCYENILNEGLDMSLDTFYNVAEKAIFSSSNAKIKFIFHGGEPTIIKDDFYVKAIKFANQLGLQYHKIIEYGIQSNFISISIDKLNLYKDLNIGLGASLDGPSNIENAFRGRSSTAIRNFIKAKENGNKVGLLLTINQSNYNSIDTILPWIQDELGMKSFKANVVYNVGAGFNLIEFTPETIFNSQKKIIDFMIQTNLKLVEHNLMNEIISFAEFKIRGVKKHEGLCSAKKCGAGSKVVGVTSEGVILPCGRFGWDENQFQLGVLNDSSEISNLQFVSKVNHFHTQELLNWENCNTCEAKNICNYGCQAFILRSNSRVNLECIPTKLRYEYYDQNVTKIINLYNLYMDNKNQISSHQSYTDYSDYSDKASYDDDSYYDYNETKYSDYSDYNDHNGYNDN